MNYSLMKLTLFLTLFLFVSCEESSFFPKDNFSAITEGDDEDFSSGDTDIFIDDPELFLESFTQNANEQNKVDILWVIDNSASMGNMQENLANNFEVFIDRFIEQEMDFNMAIVTTDTRPQFVGKPVPNSIEKLNSAAAQADEYQFKEDFKSMAQVGTNGWGIEKGLSAAKEFFERNDLDHFLRKDALLAIVVVGDEDDQSAFHYQERNDVINGFYDWLGGHIPLPQLYQIFSPVSLFTNYYQSLKSNPARVQVHSIVNIAANQVGYGVIAGADRFIEASQLTNGAIAEIEDDFYETLDELSKKIYDLSVSFALQKYPDPSSIKVYVDDLRSYDWEYDESNNAIRFFEGKQPQEGADIKVTFKKL